MDIENMSEEQRRKYTLTALETATAALAAAAQIQEFHLIAANLHQAELGVRETQPDQLILTVQTDIPTLVVPIRIGDMRTTAKLVAVMGGFWENKSGKPAWQAAYEQAYHEFKDNDTIEWPLD